MTVSEDRNTAAVAERLPSPAEAPDLWITTESTKVKLGISQAHVYRLIESRALTTWRIPGHRTWNWVLLADVERMAEQAVTRAVV